MASKGVLKLIAVLTTLALCRGQGRGRYCNPATLTERIFKDYSPLVRPDPNGDPINVGHQFELLSINSLDLETGKISIEVWEDVYWTDERLTWNFCSNSKVRVERDQVWLPIVVLYFGANQPNDKVANSLISITKDGLTGYTAHRTLEQYCELANPFDAGAGGNCSFTVGSWNYDVLDLDWTVFTGGPMSTAYFRDINPDVEVVSTSSVIKDLKFDCCDDPFKVIEYTLAIRRKPTVL